MTATLRQLGFIDQLVEELGLEGEIKDGVYAVAKEPSARAGVEVRALIDGLMARRDARRAKARRDERAAQATRGMWKDVPDGRYAVPLEMLQRHDLTHLIGGEGDMVFVRVNTWTPDGEPTSVTYCRQIKGSPGAFAKIKHSPGVNRSIRDALVEMTPTAAGKLFSEVYTCCARCMSPLTDQRSRETGYGPDCRAHMGLA